MTYGGLTLEQLRALESAASPGQWKACGASKPCGCGQVWAVEGDHPVATVVRGKWGDDYPALRIVDKNGDPTSGTAIGSRVEAYTEMIEYGAIENGQGQANAALIAAARNALPDLLREVEKLRAVCLQMAEAEEAEKEA